MTLRKNGTGGKAAAAPRRGDAVLCKVITLAYLAEGKLPSGTPTMPATPSPNVTFSPRAVRQGLALLASPLSTRGSPRRRQLRQRYRRASTEPHSMQYGATADGGGLRRGGVRTDSDLLDSAAETRMGSFAQGGGDLMEAGFGELTCGTRTVKHTTPSARAREGSLNVGTRDLNTSSNAHHFHPALSAARGDRAWPRLSPTTGRRR